MSPAVLDTRVRVGQEPQDLATVLEDSDSEIETPLPEDQDRSRRLSSLSMKAALSAVKPPSRGTSIYSLESGPDVDGERSSTDDFSERAHLPVAPSAYPAFHLPRPRRIYTTSESDLPSLTARTSISSTSSSVPGTPSHLSMTSSLHTHSPPASPLPISMIEAQLEVIPEKIFEDDDSRRLSSSSEESLTAISFAPMEPSQRRALTLEISPPVSARSETTFLGSAVAERPTQPGHKQSISSLDSSRSVQPESVSRWRRSPTPSTSSSGSSPTPRWSGGGSLRFLSLSPKTDKDVNARSIMPGGKESITKDHINDAKARKAEEKRRKKEEAKARTEQLALQLKQRAAERKAEADKQSLGSGKGRDKKDAVMYGGMVWM
ncbi:hypothetical protein NEOLEDRAFT_943373 [Neolentinus lepideus HHB14362 ss-1]|uniref:Uncharacterized protein n=1 Tax=Neolentinus lepideus HHB14362 ss-1 TaxID=1314782 RepID=A0A165NDF7_9AGAM|nr:hypothetical protein NEOLEDRAFT_943373 [Neolentinus lepideus HHB14362 ss-1]